MPHLQPDLNASRSPGVWVGLVGGWVLGGGREGQMDIQLRWGWTVGQMDGQTDGWTDGEGMDEETPKGGTLAMRCACCGC